MNILLVGSGAREHAIARSIKKSKIDNNLFCIASNRNPGIDKLTKQMKVGNIGNPTVVVNFAIKYSIDLTIIGPESPLANGIVDTLQANSIKCVGPTMTLSQLETSKSFTRNLMTKYNIIGIPEYQSFSKLDGVNEFLEKLGENYVVKFDGLMGGKGVKVSGEHLNSHQDAINYCKNIIANDGKFVIEEKLIGEEFSLMSFCDGDNLIHMPPIQDHKRAFENDTGPNTGGMGSYNDKNQSLPFLDKQDIESAQQINISVAKALKKEFDIGYKGIIYGGFIATVDGIKVIEYNARLGDPEAINVLSLLESDFLELCIGIVNGSINKYEAIFSNKATVCKYAVPNGYPNSPIKGEYIDISEVKYPEHLYFASVDYKKEKLIELGSRTVAVLGIADSLSEAENIAQSEIEQIKGPLFYRKDIGTERLVKKRVNHMKELQS